MTEHSLQAKKHTPCTAPRRTICICMQNVSVSNRIHIHVHIYIYTDIYVYTGINTYIVEHMAVFAALH